LKEEDQPRLELRWIEDYLDYLVTFESSS